jgi:hypothetical protein
MVWKGYRSRLHKCNDFNAYGLFSRDNYSTVCIHSVNLKELLGDIQTN